MNLTDAKLEGLRLMPAGEEELAEEEDEEDGFNDEMDLVMVSALPPNLGNIQACAGCRCRRSFEQSLAWIKELACCASCVRCATTGHHSPLSFQAVSAPVSSHPAMLGCCAE